LCWFQWFAHITRNILESYTFDFHFRYAQNYPKLSTLGTLDKTGFRRLHGVRDSSNSDQWSGPDLKNLKMSLQNRITTEQNTEEHVRVSDCRRDGERYWGDNKIAPDLPEVLAAIMLNFKITDWLTYQRS
jgi:hypothetical protein